MRWGIEHLNIDEARLKRLGAVGLMPALKVSCMDHEGSGMVKFQQWDGKEFKTLTPFMAGDRALVHKMVEQGAEKYAAEKKITPRDCSKEM
jgi:branched-chain amino acid transport system substrate-binding protein